MLYHGTTHYFRKFKNKNLRNSCHVGSGVYLTSCLVDANNNYARLGPDVKQKLYDVIDSPEVYSHIVGNTSYLLECEVTTDNLAIISKKKWYYTYTYDEEEDYEPQLTKLGQAIYDNSDIELEPEMTLYSIHKAIVDSYNYDDYDGTNGPGVIFKQIIIDAGFDGVIYDDVYDFFPNMVQKGTKHYVIYDTDMVKIRKRRKLGDFSKIKDEFISCYA